MVKGKWVSNGFAMFAMFFGAGNVIFPLIVGGALGGDVYYALIGLLLTAVLMPFSGLLAITLFEGDYLSFFQRIGKWPGLLMSFIVIAVLGPFGAIPRCVSLTYASLKFYIPEVSLIPFTLAACIFIFFCSFKKQSIIDLLGFIFTPILLLFLGIIVVKGLFFSPHGELFVAPLENRPFLYGLKGGYNTMDLMAALFFSSIICARLRKDTEDQKIFLKNFSLAALLGAFLLGAVYIGFGLVASFYSSVLQGVPSDQLLSSIGALILGPYAGFIVCMAVLLSSLTTAIALATVSAEFLQNIFSFRYITALIIVLFITGLITMLEFSGIVRMLGPFLEICYPALIVLSLCNILHKTFDFQFVKAPVYGVILFMLYEVYIC
jgi:LIVCS family branched-chain amino acid:cation transporter